MESAVLSLRVVPKSSQDAVVGWQGGALKIKVRAAPEDGKANAAVIEILAKTLGVPRKTIVLESGHASRNKRVRIEGFSVEAIKARLG